jgi:hypothetical protein
VAWLIVVTTSGLFMLGCALVIQVFQQGLFVRLGLGALLGLLGAGLLFLAYALYRRLRPRRAGHLRVSIDRRQPRRGDDVEVALSLLNPRKVGQRLELGLVCTELYDENRSVPSGSGGSSEQRVTLEHPEHEEWREISSTEPHQLHRFAIPVSAPYSHRGECLSFAWRVSAREPTRFRFDPSVNEEIDVQP